MAQPESERDIGDARRFRESVKTLKAGEGVYSTEEQVMRWGDYTHTTLDPLNSLSIWTIQQYARTPNPNWRSWVGEIMPVKP